MVFESSYVVDAFVPGPYQVPGGKMIFFKKIVSSHIFKPLRMKTQFASFVYLSILSFTLDFFHSAEYLEIDSLIKEKNW